MQVRLRRAGAQSRNQGYVVELVYTYDSKSYVARHVGSTPTIPTSIKLSGILPTDFTARSAPSVLPKKGSDFAKQALKISGRILLLAWDGINFRDAGKIRKA